MSDQSGSIEAVSEQNKEMIELQESFSDGSRIFEVNEENFRNPNCIDGRDDDIERPSIPGGAIGALGVVLATLDAYGNEYNRETVTNIIKKYFGNDFSGHTDSHAKDGHQCQGCGHMARLTDQGDKYSLKSESSELLREVANNIPENKVIKLLGDHDETNVVIVNIPGYGVKSNHNGRQDFVYNIAYANELYGELAGLLTQVTGISQEELSKTLTEMAQNHVMQTAGDLAPNFNAFIIDAIDGNKIPEINLFGVIPDNKKLQQESVAQATNEILN